MAFGQSKSELREIETVAVGVVDAHGMGCEGRLCRAMVSGRNEIDRELHFRVAGSSLPASFESAGGCGGEMESRNRVSRRIEGGCEIFRGKIVQMNNEKGVLNRRRLGLGGFLAAFVWRAG